MAKQKPRTLSGFMELLPARQVQFERMAELLRRTYALYGFTPLDTPIIEASEVLLAKAGGETEKQIYRFNKGDTDLSLRFDLTVPLAKYVAMHYAELSFPFRRFQIGKVYRGERAQRGRFREFYQADIDVIGDGKLDIANEAEIPSIIYRTFTALGLRRFQIRVNNRKILNGFYAMLGLTEQSGDVMRAVDKLPKIGAEKVGAILRDEVGLEQNAVDEILKFISITGSNNEVLSALEEYRGRQAGHRQRGGDPRHHLSDLHHPGAETVPDPGEQPQGAGRLLRHAGPDGKVRRHHAHRGQAAQNRPGKGGRDAPG